ncbi:MAG: carboxypeptidase [Bdellovibrionaceae bacterium]|nr:carboxypeptidase [Pseudobdellovibrionaceae bacterium]|tara:strand:- start:4798 stop:5466 length:669 start_codon:yes stop_codon:yes gene_type:complete
MMPILFGRTTQNLPIWGNSFLHQGPSILILGGVHGDETEGVIACLELQKLLFEKKDPFKLNITIVPAFNQDGVLAGTRHNANGVDLNRNLPTKDWEGTAHQKKYQPGPSPNSESENQALVQWIETHHPHFIFSLHSWKPTLNLNGECDEVAKILMKKTGYESNRDMGYPTPGCLGTYTGHERNIPTITYEIERGSSTQDIVNLHPPALMEALSFLEKNQNES